MHVNSDLDVARWSSQTQFCKAGFTFSFIGISSAETLSIVPSSIKTKYIFNIQQFIMSEILFLYKDKT